MRTPTLLRAAVASLLYSTLALSPTPLVAQTTRPAHDTILRHGKLIDGTGNPWRWADVAIDGERVSAIGDLSKETAKQEIDATGCVVAPGFIDVHTHVDDDILKYPLAENFVRDGVTTIVSGNCGTSVRDVGKFFARLDANGAAVNNATLFGHNSLLTDVKGNVATKLTDEQMARAKAMVDRAMRDGAIGFSTGLIYTPGEWSDTAEIVAFAKISAAYGGIYTSHMRSESGEIKAAIEEALDVGREAGCRVEISHFKIGTTTALKFGRGTTQPDGSVLNAGSDLTLAMVQAARAAGEEVWLDQYPYTASSTTLNTLLPDWVLEKGGAEAKRILRDPTQTQKVLDAMRQQHEVTNRRTDLSYCVVASAPNHPEYAGKNIKLLAQLAKMRTADPQGAEMLSTTQPTTTTQPSTTQSTPTPADSNPRVLPDVTMEDQYREVIDIYLSGGASCVFHSMDEIEVANIMRSPLVGVASDSGLRVFGEGMPHPRGYGTNTRILGRYVRELHVIPLEEAVRKMTSMPATAFRMADRGTLRVGAFADVTIFDPATVKDLSTFDQPHQYPVGIKDVFTNGTLVFDGRDMTGAKPGHPIRGPGYQAVLSDVAPPPPSVSKTIDD